MNQTMTWFNKQSAVVQLVIVIIVLYLLYELYNYVVDTTGFVRQQTELEILAQQGETASYTESEYLKMADDLEDAMDGIGTYNDDLYAVFGKLKNTTDFIKLSAAFGIRSGSDNLFGILPPSDLAGWIQDDLSQSEIEQLNRFLANKGIKKGF